ncbi:ribonuclease T2 family protein [Colletotrichum higginsianum IMI 349063]|uniref:ribonuclease T2 n=3 Tax=Colletotrichum destructivum species complex TaxID=2707350 RepID=A0A1B7XW79_COLHI|nr:ribonuclease T2 family protein [Colletotrichum higginsianum IMI 349063]OBR03990.1 ribonuclease T2 family protein [Colletotrichum higginsianum IMI 349063]GJD03648.1 ribonuclease T2 family protein [Colletotrichum higginsianum]
MAPSLRALLARITTILPTSQTPFTSPSSHDITAADANANANGIAVTPYEPLSGAPSCPIDGPLSCHNATGPVNDACCFVAPSGRLLLTQFWDDTVHAGGAEEDWTVHGLWPDLCDGSYKAYCGMTPHFNNITDILQHYGQGDLLASMERYWVAAYGTNNHLWAHEYNKHASCINTLSASCYADAYAPGVEVVDYFTRAFSLFRQLDTFTALERAGIAPSHSRRYPLADVRRTLEELSGGRVVLRCQGRGRDVLHEAWYSYFLQGSLQTGQFVPAGGLGDHGDANNCAPEVRYPPKKCKGNCPGSEEL